jgi:hypothetical protein
MMNACRREPWDTSRYLTGKCQYSKDQRIRVLAEHLVLKDYHPSLKGKFRTLKMALETENLLRERARSFERKLRRESLLFDKLKRRKGKVSLLRRRFVYWRLFYQDKLTVQMIIWLLNADSATIKSNIGVAYHKIL